MVQYSTMFILHHFFILYSTVQVLLLEFSTEPQFSGLLSPFVQPGLVDPGYPHFCPPISLQDWPPSSFFLPVRVAKVGTPALSNSTTPRDLIFFGVIGV